MRLVRLDLGRSQESVGRLRRYVRPSSAVAEARAADVVLRLVLLVPGGVLLPVRVEELPRVGLDRRAVLVRFVPEAVPAVLRWLVLVVVLVLGEGGVVGEYAEQAQVVALQGLLAGDGVLQLARRLLHPAVVARLRASVVARLVGVLVDLRAVDQEERGVVPACVVRRQEDDDEGEDE